MAKKTTSKLALRKETLRQIGAHQLGHVVGGLATGAACLGNQDTRNLGSTLPSLGDFTTGDISGQAGGGGR